MSDFEGRLARLRQRKLEQTFAKREHNGYMDEDDYGNVLPPEDFHFEPEENDPIHHTFYGAKFWGRNFRRLLERHPLYIDPDDALAGRWMFILQRMRPFESPVSNDNMEMAPLFDYSYLKPTQQRYGIIPGIGKMHHFAPDYQIGLELGFGGLLEKVRYYAKLYPQQAEFYQAEEDVLFGIRTWIARTVDEIHRMAQVEQDLERKNNLQEMERINEWLIDHPPRTFREVCQFIAWINMANRTYCRAGAGTQLDECLRPYYERDKSAGILTDDEARFIIACLFINDPHYYQIGGPDCDGRDVTSPLSFLILEAAHEVGVTVNLTIRVHDGLDPRLLRRGVEILCEDQKGCPRFSGDKALEEGFMRHGYSAELARRRIAVGCHWMSLPGMEYTLNDLIKINLAKVFEVAFWEMMEGKEQSVPLLYHLYQKHLTLAIQCVGEGIDFHLEYQHLNAPELMLNLFSHGPIEKGLDASHGGMDFYNICVDAAGLATVADSFAALEQRIEHEHRLTWDQCAAAMKENYQSPSANRTRAVLKTSQHFGYGGGLGDDWAVRISRDFTQRVSSHRTPNGYLMIPGLFSWANTIMLGQQVGATPNGRYAGTPVSHGANPDPGFRKDAALTAMSDAIASVQPGLGNTAPFQLELNTTLVVHDDAVNNIISVIKTHFEQGGTLINANVISGQQILEAYQDPSKYPDLVVRVTGFTAYFATLSPEFRKLVAERIINM